LYLQCDNIFSSKGVQIWTERIRNGSIVGYLGNNNDFDYFSPTLNSISGFITRGDRVRSFLK
jgi:hypothetical protein